MSSRRKPEVNVQQSNPSHVFAKAMKAKSQWSDKDEFLDVVYWMRQIMALIVGLLWGILPMKGFLGIILFVALSTLAVYVYSNSFQQVDDEEMGGYQEILKEGLMTSFATFLISWIILYSALHH